MQITWINIQLEKLVLRLNKEKAKQLYMGEVGTQIDFLGFSFKKIKGYIRKSVYIKFQSSKKIPKKLKYAIRNRIKHQTPFKLNHLIRKLNPILRE